MSSKTKAGKKENTVKVLKKEKEEPEIIQTTTQETENKGKSKKHLKPTADNEQHVEKVTKKENVESTEPAKDAHVPDELKFISQLELAQEEIKKMKERFHSLNANLKKLESAYTSDIKRVSKNSAKKIIRRKKTGFNKPKVVPEKLAKFIGVASGTELTGPEVTKKVWFQLREKGLMYEKDKRVFRTNQEVSDVFDVPKFVNKSTRHDDKEGFNFRNLQKYIANAYKQK